MFLRDILGQERVVGFLRQALESNKMPHALLFIGSEGVGKGLPPWPWLRPLIARTVSRIRMPAANAGLAGYLPQATIRIFGR